MGQIKLLLLALFTSGLNFSAGFAQTFDATAFIGYWISDETSARTIIFTDRDSRLQMVKWDGSDGEEIEVTHLDINGSSIHTTEVTHSTDWVIQCTYSPMDDNTLEYAISREGEMTFLFLKRLK